VFVFPFCTGTCLWVRVSDGHQRLRWELVVVVVEPTWLGSGMEEPRVVSVGWRPYAFIIFVSLRCCVYTNRCCELAFSRILVVLKMSCLLHKPTSSSTAPQIFLPY